MLRPSSSSVLRGGIVSNWGGLIGHKCIFPTYLVAYRAKLIAAPLPFPLGSYLGAFFPDYLMSLQAPVLRI